MQPHAWHFPIFCKIIPANVDGQVEDDETNEDGLKLPLCPLPKCKVESHLAIAIHSWLRDHFFDWKFPIKDGEENDRHESEEDVVDREKIHVVYGLA